MVEPVQRYWEASSYSPPASPPYLHYSTPADHSLRRPQPSPKVLRTATVQPTSCRPIISMLFQPALNISKGYNYTSVKGGSLYQMEDELSLTAHCAPKKSSLQADISSLLSPFSQQQPRCPQDLASVSLTVRDDSESTSKLSFYPMSTLPLLVLHLQLKFNICPKVNLVPLLTTF